MSELNVMICVLWNLRILKIGGYILYCNFFYVMFFLYFGKFIFVIFLFLFFYLIYCEYLVIY